MNDVMSESGRRKCLESSLLTHFSSNPAFTEFSLSVQNNIDGYFPHLYISDLKGGDITMAKKKAAAKKTTKKTTKKK